MIEVSFNAIRAVILHGFAGCPAPLLLQEGDKVLWLSNPWMYSSRAHQLVSADAGRQESFGAEGCPVAVISVARLVRTDGVQRDADLAALPDQS